MCPCSSLLFLGGLFSILCIFIVCFLFTAGLFQEEGHTGKFLVSHTCALPASSRKCCMLLHSQSDAVDAACQMLLQTLGLALK